MLQTVVLLTSLLQLKRKFRNVAARALLSTTSTAQGATRSVWEVLVVSDAGVVASCTLGVWIVSIEVLSLFGLSVPCEKQ